MRVVTLEEHFVVPSLVQNSFPPNHHLSGMKPEILEALGEIGNKRLGSMDKGHVSVQVLSAAAPGASDLEGQEGIDFARTTNDTLAEATKRHPQRFSGFAHLPMRDPIAAAQELERAVMTLGFRGALINGTTNGFFLDHERFRPVLQKAEELDVPLYLHPALPPTPVREAYYDNLPENYGLMLSMAGFGWHIEVAIHVLRLVLSGTLERHPKLKLIIGHMGETLPFMLERTEQVFQNQKKPVFVKDAILKHVWITTSGFFTLPPFLTALHTFGADRILYSVDYPFSANEKGWEFLKTLPIAPQDLKKIAHENADRLLKLERC